LLSIVLAMTCDAGTKDADAKSQTKRPDLAGCGGDDLAAYIGKPVDELRQRNLANVQFICQKDCVVISDFRSARLTVVYSRRTNLIMSMFCG
jgi:hypothetical protein